MSTSIYSNPLVERYASERMAALFSPQTRYGTWRQLWIALAEAEKELGLPITKTQIDELKKYGDTINFSAARKIEKEVRHDVMAHVLAYGRQAKKAAGIIHLGATSCYVTDNADLIIFRDALRLVCDRLTDVLRSLTSFTMKERARPTLGFTHLQPAQITTVGKRAALWLQDFQLDFDNLQVMLSQLKFRGVKGTTGTQGSFLELFKGDHTMVKKLDTLVAKKCGFKESYAVCGQTYPRKVDADILHCLTGIALSVSKMTNDIRYLQSIGEIEEPFGRKQIGSSAMAYKRNPMRCERADSLARLILSLASSPQMTAATQFLERTLDDSANRRIVLPEAFLATDAILTIVNNVAAGLVVYPKVIEKRLGENLPFLATEAVIMLAVSKGRSRQVVHERIRIHSMETVKQIRNGGCNDLLDRLAGDTAVGLTKAEIMQELDPLRFAGRAPQQTEEYIKDVIRPLLRKYKRYFPVDKTTVKY